MRPTLSRREFLKLGATLPLLHPALSYYFGERKVAPANPDAPNVIILVFDTFSALHLPMFGYPRQTAPNIARFAERATVYHNHYTPGNFTTPGTASLLTGVYPWTSRAFGFKGNATPDFDDRNIFSLFADSGYYRIAYTHNPLADILLQQFQSGMSVLKPLQELFLAPNDPWLAGLFANDYDMGLTSRFHILERGNGEAFSLFLSELVQVLYRRQNAEILKQYRPNFPRGVPSLDSVPNYFLLEDAIDWIGEVSQASPSPFLGYFHLFPPHLPYRTRKEFIDIFDDGWEPVDKPRHRYAQSLGNKERLLRLRRQYDEYIAYVDAEFGRLYDALQSSGVLDKSYLVLTSDHGELFERGIHGHVVRPLFQPLLRVPLFIARPGQHARVDVHSPTTSIDLLPTLLRLTGQPIPEWIEGQVLPPFGDQPLDGTRTLYALEAKNNPKYEPIEKATVGIIKDGWKLSYYIGYSFRPFFELYNLNDDPEELDDQSAFYPQTRARLLEELRVKLDEADEPYRE